MKIAIVTGGFDGVSAQMHRWNLERDLERARQSVKSAEASLKARRTHLSKLEAQLAITPTKEISP